MQVAMRRLIIIGAISLGGAAAGLALGNFAAGGSKLTGAEELANYGSFFASSENVAEAADMDAGFSERSGPSSYNCQGCDAQLHNDMMPGDASAADTTPLPPYRPEDGPAVVPQTARPPAPASGLLAVPSLPPVLAADRSRPPPPSSPAPPPDH